MTAESRQSLCDLAFDYVTFFVNSVDEAFLQTVSSQRGVRGEYHFDIG